MNIMKICFPKIDVKLNSKYILQFLMYFVGSPDKYGDDTAKTFSSKS